MYCVRCGVKLQDGVDKCPLCDTPVLIDYSSLKDMSQKYSDLYPKEERHGKMVILAIITAVMLAGAIACLTACLKLYGAVRWSGICMLAILLGYILFILPIWFDKWHPLIFLPVDTGVIAGFLLYLCLYTKGKWFLSFAFPLTLFIGAVLIVATVLYTFIKKGRLFITGGLLIALGGISVLIEFFAHLTFKTGMFVWSLYCVSILGVLGLFLIIAGTIPPFRDYLRRKFFY